MEDQKNLEDYSGSSAEYACYGRQETCVSSAIEMILQMDPHTFLSQKTFGSRSRVARYVSWRVDGLLRWLQESARMD